MAAFCFDTIHPRVSEQSWMIDAALLSLVFLGYGAWSRLWGVHGLRANPARAVDVHLSLSDNAYSFPWTWWAAAIPIAVVFATGWIVREFLPRQLKASDSSRDLMRIVARVYQSVALGLLIRWVFGIAPYPGNYLPAGCPGDGAAGWMPVPAQQLWRALGLGIERGWRDALPDEYRPVE